MTLSELYWQAYGISRADTDAGIATTNLKDGGWTIDVENVVFVSVNFDPWASASITNNATGFVNLKSHVEHSDGMPCGCDVYAAAPSDLLAPRAAHDHIGVGHPRLHA
ncbi:hypothetical protein DYB32_008013 [Aphanomyces invadans]|nr:hypothetical protein DYB32_008013 [Aphanomyces invadans]